MSVPLAVRVKVLVVSSMTQEKNGELAQAAARLKAKWGERAIVMHGGQVNWPRVSAPIIRTDAVDKYEAAAIWAVRLYDRLAVLPTEVGALSKGTATIADRFFRAGKVVYLVQPHPLPLRVLTGLRVRADADQPSGWSSRYADPL